VSQPPAKKIAVRRFQRQFKAYRDKKTSKRISFLEHDLERAFRKSVLDHKLHRAKEELEERRQAAIASFHNSLAEAHGSSINCQHISYKRTRSGTLKSKWESSFEARSEAVDETIDRLNATFEQIDEHDKDTVLSVYREHHRWVEEIDMKHQRVWVDYFFLPAEPDGIFRQLQPFASIIQKYQRNCRCTKRQRT